MKKLIVFAVLCVSPFVFSQNKSIFNMVEGLKVDVKPELSKEKTQRYDKQLQSFVVALKNKDKSKVTSLLSDKIMVNFTDESLRQLSGGISFDREMEVYKSGFQVLSNGENVAVLQYKFANDNTNPPKDIVTVLFEDNGKILGVLPVYSK